MHKDELIQLHTLLCQLKNWFESSGTNVGTPFKEYEDYGVAPQHIHKSKLQHKRAVFLLGKDLAAAIGGAEEFSGAHRVGHRMGELAKKVAGVKRMDAVPTAAQS
jgi:hypothetical protein